MISHAEQSVVLLIAGGKGSRLKAAVTDIDPTLPKSLGVELHGRPLIAYQLDLILQAIPAPAVLLAFNDQFSKHSFLLKTRSPAGSLQSDQIWPIPV